VLAHTEDAERALATARAQGRELRFDLREHCHTGRYRLSVRYQVPDPKGGPPRDVNLGLLWSEDRPALEALKERLERAGVAHDPSRR
jgi:hypothetical protein